jgi:hypothetical protein
MPVEHNFELWLTEITKAVCFSGKIKADGNRVDVKNWKTDNTLPNITGGYITKADKTTGGDPIASGRN